MLCWNIAPIILFVLIRTSLVSGLTVLPAIGRTAQLGELYDAVLDKFLDVRIFRKEWNSSVVATVDTPMSEVSQMRVTRLRDKANLLGVSASLTIGIYSGLIELVGTAEYIREESSASSSQSQVFSYKVRTKREVLQDYGEDLKGFISEDALSLNATHVITAVDYGADVFIEFNTKDVPESKRESIYGELALYFRKFEAIANVKASVSVNHTDFGNGTDRSLSIRIFGDLTISKYYPVTSEDIENFLETVPGKILQKGGARGNPVSYTISPIEQFRKKFGSNQTNPFRRASSLNETQSFEFLIIFEEIQSVQARMKQMADQFRINEDFLPFETITNLEELKSSFEDVVLSLKKNVSEGLVLAREGDDTVMPQIRKDYEANNFSAAKVGRILRAEYEAALAKSEEIQSFRNHEIQVLGRTGSVPEVLLKYPDQTIQMLFMKPSFKSERNWARNVALLLRPLKNALSQLVLADCSFHSPFCPNVSLIQEFHNGKVLSEDVLQDFKERTGNRLEMVGTGEEMKLGDLFDVRSGKFTGTTVLGYFDVTAELEDKRACFEYSNFTADSSRDLFAGLGIPGWQGAAMLASDEGVFDFKILPNKLTGFASFIRRNSSRRLSLTAKPALVGTDEVFQKEVTHYVSRMEVAAIDVFAFHVHDVPENSQASFRSSLVEDMAKFRTLFQDFQEKGADITKLDMSLKYSRVQIFTNFRGFPLEFGSLASFLEHLNATKALKAAPVNLPIYLILKPVSFLQETLKLVIPAPAYTEISDERSRSIIEVYDQINRALSLLHEFHLDFLKYPQVAEDEDYDQFLEVTKRLGGGAESWKYKVHSALQKVRYGEETEDALATLITSFWAEEIGKMTSTYFAKEFPLLRKRLATAEKADSLGMRVLGRGDWFQEIFMTPRINASVAMVNFGNSTGVAELEDWIPLGKHGSIVDCQFFPRECSGVSDFEGREYKHGEIGRAKNVQLLMREVQVQASYLRKEVELFGRNLTKHYDGLKAVTEL